MCRTNRYLGRDEAAAWPGQSSAASGRRTALFESDDGAEAVAVDRILGDMDIDTMWCPGPGRDHGRRCPLVQEGHCELMDRADFVINNLGTDSPQCAAVAQAADGYLHGEKPIAVVTRRHETESIRSQLPGCTVVGGPLTRQIVSDIAHVD